MNQKTKTSNVIGLRALILGALSFRAHLESALEIGQDVDINRQIVIHHQQWLKNFAIDQHMQDEEKNFLFSEAGSWNAQCIEQQFWKIEGFRALLWVMGDLECMPSYYQLNDVKDIFVLTQFPNSPESFLAFRRVRPALDIDDEVKVYQFLYWRCRTEIFRQKGYAPPDGQTYDDTIKKMVENAPKGSTQIDKDLNDLLIEGKTFSEYNNHSRMLTTCQERLKALSWVLSDLSWADIEVGSDV